MSVTTCTHTHTHTNKLQSVSHKYDMTCCSSRGAGGIELLMQSSEPVPVVLLL